MTSHFDYPSTVQESGFIDICTKAGEIRSIFVLSMEELNELMPRKSDYDRVDALLAEKPELTEPRSTKELINKHILKK